MTATIHPLPIPEPTAEERPVLVLDLGGQYAQLIARRVRDARVYSELVPHTLSVAEIRRRNPIAMILSGGPASVYADGAPQGRPGALRARHPDARHLLRRPADGARARRRGRANRDLRVRQDRARGRCRCAVQRAAAAANGLDEPSRHGHRAAARRDHYRAFLLDSRGGVRGPGQAALRRAVPPRSAFTPRTGRTC